MIPVQILGKKKDGQFCLKTIREIKESNDFEELARELYYDYTVGVEIVYLVMYDYDGNIKSFFQCSQGDVESSTVNKRSIVTALVLSGQVNCFSMIHNHPSEKAEASENDYSVDGMIRTLSMFIGIDFLQDIVATSKELIVISDSSEEED